jgi:denticleless
VKEPALLHSSPFDPTSLHDSRRPRGIISLARGTGPTAGVIFALGTDSLIHAYARDSLRPYGTSYTHSNLQTNFYVGLACSPCGRFLASGGAGAKGSSFLFDVGNTTHGPHSTSVGVELKGQSGDAGAVDWADSGTLSTCWDDGTVRVWRPEVDTYSACMEQPEEKRWDWCWASAI